MAIIDLIVVFLFIDLAGFYPELSGEINSSLISDAMAVKFTAGKIYCVVNTVTLPIKFQINPRRKIISKNPAPCERAVSTL